MSAVLLLAGLLANLLVRQERLFARLVPAAEDVDFGTRVTVATLERGRQGVGLSPDAVLDPLMERPPPPDA